MDIGRSGTTKGPRMSDRAAPTSPDTESLRFSDLFDQYGPALLRYARYRVGIDAAEDLVAEVFATAYSHRHRFDVARGGAGPWLFGIASTLVRAHRRAEQRALRALTQGGVDRASESFTEQVDDKVTAAASTRTMAAALARLKRRDRDVLLLTAVAELSYAETAEALGISIGTVRSRLHRARSAMREAFDHLDPRGHIEGSGS